jgi:hypothetical protein
VYTEALAKVYDIRRSEGERENGRKTTKDKRQKTKDKGQK